MNHLSAEEIINIQIKLLQSSGKTLTTLHKTFFTGTSKSQFKIFKQFDKKHLSHKIRKMIVSNVTSMGTDINANLRAFSIIILKLIFTKQPDQQILSILKSHLHDYETDLTKIKNITNQSLHDNLSHLSNNQYKKILVEFLYALKQSNIENKIQTQCKKYPLALQLLVILWRTILLKFKIPQAENYSKKISTTAAYEILFQFLDLFYCKSGKLYLLRDQNLFIQNGYQNQNKQFVQQIVLGNYYENQEQYKNSILKNLSNPLIFNGENLKVASSSLNSCQVNIKYQHVESINPFQLIIPKGSSKVFDSTHSNNSNRSLKSSHAFQKRNFILSSNRSQNSFIIQDQQCDNPTPSFNHITQDQVHQSFRATQDFTRDASTIQKSPRGNNLAYIMKESATILPAKNKVLRSSLLQQFKGYHNPQKGSIQLQPQIKSELGLKNSNQQSGLQTADSPINQIFSTNPFQNILEPQIKQNILKHQNIKPQKNQKKLLQQDRKTMKRSQSQKNSMMKLNQLNEQDVNRQSLFTISCKKLKTSVQINQADFYSQKEFKFSDINNLNDQHFKDLCQHTNYTCSCYSLKIQRNKIVSNTFNICLKPQPNLKYNFFKKQIKVKQVNEQQYKQFKPKSKLTDDFFKNLRVKRLEEKIRSPNTKNKSDPKYKEQKNNKKPNFIKYSQFIKFADRSVSRSKTPDKSQKPFKKKVFPVSFKKLQTFLYHSPPHQPGLNKFESNKQQNKSVSGKSINKFVPRKPQPSKTFHTHNSKLYPLYSTPTTPAAVVQDHLKQKMNGPKLNSSFQNYSNLDYVTKGNRKPSFNYFSPSSSNGFGRNDYLFYKSQESTSPKI